MLRRVCAIVGFDSIYIYVKAMILFAVSSGLRTRDKCAAVSQYALTAQKRKQEISGDRKSILFRYEVSR